MGGSSILSRSSGLATSTPTRDGVQIIYTPTGTGYSFTGSAMTKGNVSVYSVAAGRMVLRPPCGGAMEIQTRNGIKVRPDLTISCSRTGTLVNVWGFRDH